MKFKFNKILLILFIITVCAFLLLISKQYVKEQVNSNQETGTLENIKEEIIEDEEFVSEDIEETKNGNIINNIDKSEEEATEPESGKPEKIPESTEYTIQNDVIATEETEEQEENTVYTEETESYEETEEELKLISLGEFTLTAYCSCVNCCGQYALNRPLDENGNEIVYGSLGIRLIAGYSIAVDPYVIPYETEVIINGNTYVAHDTGSSIKGNRIDIYFDNHQEAYNFGVQYAEVFLKK